MTEDSKGTHAERDASLARTLYEARRGTALLDNDVPKGSYVVMAYEPRMEADRKRAFTDRAAERAGFIAHFDREDWMPPREMRARVMVPCDGKRSETHAKQIFVDVSTVSCGPLIELVEYPHGDIKALTKLRERVEKSLTKARKERSRAR